MLYLTEEKIKCLFRTYFNRSGNKMSRGRAIHLYKTAIKFSVDLVGLIYYINIKALSSGQKKNFQFLYKSMIITSN